MAINTRFVVWWYNAEEKKWQIADNYLTRKQADRLVEKLNKQNKKTKCELCN